jgi:hypothetical protein
VKSPTKSRGKWVFVHEPIRNDFANDFGLFRLHSVLQTLGCDSATQNRLIDWYWRNATWDAESQGEFDTVARIHLADAARLESVVAELRPAIRGGSKVSIPAKLRSDKFLGYDRQGREKFSTTGLKDDAEQDAWVRVLEAGKSDGRSAYIAGMSAGRDAFRDNAKHVPVSQMVLPEDETEAPIEPWEQSIDILSNDFDRQVWRLLREVEDDNRRKALLDFWDESPEDVQFLFSYLARRRHRKRPAPQPERDRATNILKKLRQMEQKTVA